MIHVVTDTDANLPPDVLDQFTIAFVPIHIIFGDEVMRERMDFSDEEAFARMQNAPNLPTTSQPSVGEFVTLYQQIVADDPAATILSVHISGKLSGTCEAARQAAKLVPAADVHVFDTLSASHGQGLMVREAARMAQQDAALADIIARLEVMRERMTVYFVLNTLEYLAKGGRIGKASHLMGNMLQIKPILTVEDGVIDAHSKQRTWKKAVAGLRALVIDEGRGDGELHLGVVHAMSEDEAQDLLADLQDALAPGVTIFGSLGPGLGVHTGPGALGVCFARLPAME